MSAAARYPQLAEAYRDGAAAFVSGRADDACPHRDCTDAMPMIAWVDTPAAKRQSWLAGYAIARRCDIMTRYGAHAL